MIVKPLDWGVWWARASERLIQCNPAILAEGYLILSANERMPKHVRLRTSVVVLTSKLVTLIQTESFTRYLPELPFLFVFIFNEAWDD